MSKFFRKIFVFLILSILIVAFCGQVMAEDISNAAYINPAYVAFDKEKNNCELGGAWTNNYSYFWLPDPSENRKNFPKYIQNITYRGVLQEFSFKSISSPEINRVSGEKNKYYLTSSLPGEAATLILDVVNNNNSVNWVPLSIYFDPFTTKKLEQRLTVKLSYADGSLGHIVLIQNVNFTKGCYLNLLVKAPLSGTAGTIEIEVQPKNELKPVLSGVFWGEVKSKSDIVVNHVETLQSMVPVQFQNKTISDRTTIWSPGSVDNSSDEIIYPSVGEIDYVTSTGYEFPSSKRTMSTYNFKAFQGIAGPEGFNGLEFYITPIKGFCSKGCNLGLYFAENYKQKISVYTAQTGKENKLAATKETIGGNIPSFEVFKIEPNEETALRVRITTSNLISVPVLRGLYIDPSFENPFVENINDVTLSLDFKEIRDDKKEGEKNNSVKIININPVTLNSDKVSSIKIIEPVKDVPEEQIPQVSIETNDLIKEEVKEHASEIKEEIKEQTEEIKEEVKEHANEIKEEVKEQAEEIKEEVKEHANEIKEEVKGQAEEIKEEMKEHANKAAEQIEETMEHVRKECADQVKEHAQEVREEAREETRGHQVQEIKKTARELKTQIPQINIYSADYQGLYSNY